MCDPEVRCETRGEPLECFAGDDGKMLVWPRCPVRATYEDPYIGAVLHLRRLKALGFTLNPDAYAAWVIDLWGDLEVMEQEKREQDRKRE